MQVGNIRFRSCLISSDKEVTMKKNWRTCIALLVGITFIVVGVLQGQNQEVLAKAIRICMECVGIG